jgi:long-subunit fatty acid transport protein
LRIFTIILLFFSPSIIHSQIFRSPGTAGASFLKINLPARCEALGQSFCGLADDVSAIYYNPAGLAQIEKSELQFSNLNWYEGMNASGISFAKRKDSHTFGLDCRILLGEDYERQLVGEEIVVGGKINLCDIVLSASYAMNFVKKKTGSAFTLGGLEKEKRFALGFTVKYINEQLYTRQNSSFATDIGILYSTEDSKDFYGAALQNIGTNIGEDILPVTLRVGGSYKHETQVVSWELTQGIDSNTRISTGAEFKLANPLYFRIGGFYQGEFGYTAGLGFCIESIQIDYAYVPQKITGFNQTHNISFILRFQK